MPSRAEMHAIEASRRAIQELDGFILRGETVRPFMRALLVGDPDRASRLAGKVLMKNNLLEKIREAIEAEVPTGLFLDGEDALDAWMAHRGMIGASDSEIVGLLLMSDRWKREVEALAS